MSCVKAFPFPSLSWTFQRRPKSCLPELIDATSDELIQGLEQGDFTSLDLVNAYEQRIRSINPTVRAVLEINPDAWAVAAQLDVERRKHLLRGPLHGLPILIKGNIATNDKMQTSSGSFALEGAIPGADATVVAKLRSEGLIILGKASLTEMSMCRSNHWPHAWNSVLGQSYGAYCARQCPGGSSGGSAVATDLGLAWATIGTETDGSIVIPSERNNIVGIKPTVGLTSRHLVVPISERQDTIGPMARTVKDAARLLQAMAGPDANDKYTLESPYADTPRRDAYVAACRMSGLRGKRIGIPTNVVAAYHRDEAYAKRAFDAAVRTMRDAGAVIVHDTNLTAYEELMERSFNPVTRADFAVNFSQYMSKLSKNKHGISNVHELRAFVHASPDEAYPAIGTQVWDHILDSGITNASPEFAHLLADNMRLGGPGGVLGALHRHALDALVLPGAVASRMPALVGSPVVTVPLGVTPAGVDVVKEAVGDAVERAPGIPFGIAFLGPKWSEEVLIGMAYALEQRREVRKTVKRHVEPTVDLADVLA